MIESIGFNENITIKFQIVLDSMNNFEQKYPSSTTIEEICEQISESENISMFNFFFLFIYNSNGLRVFKQIQDYCISNNDTIYINISHFLT